MQIGYETMKLTMHPTNNRSTSAWSSGSESTSKRINKPAIISSAMSRRSLANKYVGDDVVGDHVTRLLQVCFLRPCSEEGSDAAKNPDMVSAKIQIVATVKK